MIKTGRAVELHQGERFGYLTVIEMVRLSNGRRKWRCLCDCGTTKTVSANNLTSGDSQSCGCLNISHGELKIRTLLKEYNIPIKTVGAKRMYLINDKYFKLKSYVKRFYLRIFFCNKLLYMLKYF